MLDISHIPGQSDNIWIFYANGSIWQTWVKPRKCNFIWIMCIGGGSGGYGGGGGGLAGTAPGGATGAITRALFSANVLPDTLFVQPGVGSAGGAGASAGSNPVPGTATRSWVTIIANSTAAMNTVCISGTAGASGATAETAATTAVAGLLSLGNFISTPGQATTNASQIVPLVASGIILSGGGNGSAAGNVAAADILSVNLGITNTPTISGGASISGKGNPGIWNWKPMYAIGGSGGGGNASGNGGNGGDGAFGCGGGGGGNGSSGFVGGTGGKGGDGLVIIATF